MMFLVKSAFWLLILVLLIPTDQDQQNQIYGTAQTAMAYRARTSVASSVAPSAA